MNINIPGMSLKAVFSKDKDTSRGSMDNLDSEYILIKGLIKMISNRREKFAGRTPNRSLTEHIALKQKEKEILQDLSPRFKKDSTGQSMSE